MTANRRLHDLVIWGRGLIARLVALEVLDRSLVIGAQAFSALIPLLVVIASIDPGDSGSFADELVDRFDLEGDTASAVHEAFGGASGATSLTVLGALIVTFSALSFTRAVQRTYELTWGLPRRGMRATGWGLAWLAAFATYLTIFPVVRGIFHGWPYNLMSLVGTFVIWLLTPYLLLARRIPWRKLIPQAALSAVGMTLLSGGLLIYAPRAIETSAEEFGAIGVAFALLTILWASGFVIVVAAGVGSYIATTSWTRPESRGSATPPSWPSSAARGS